MVQSYVKPFLVLRSIVRECAPTVLVRQRLPYQYLRAKVSNSWVHWHNDGVAKWVLATVESHGLQVGMLVNNLSAVCSCVLGEGQESWGTDQRVCAYCETLHYICICVCIYVWLCTHSILYYRPQHPIFFLSPLYNETPTLFLHQAYLARPLILARSSVQQKETSAQWENALIIHDHLTIQDLVCAAYVAFLISARQPHLLIAVSLLLFCVLYLWIITTQYALIIILLAVHIIQEKIFWLLKRDKHNIRMRTIFSSLLFWLVFLVICRVEAVDVCSQTFALRSHLHHWSTLFLSQVCSGNTF